MHLSLKSSLGRQILTGSYVKDNRVLDLTTPFSELTFTLEDKSGEGNDATLYSGRYISTDGSTDRGIVADCSAAGAGNYYLTGKVRPNAVTTAELTMDGSTDSGLTGLTADVWQTFTTATSAVTPSAVQVGYDGSTASAADWSDVKLIDSSDGSTVARWQLNESADGDLNGYPALDSSGNGYHGTHTGCAGGTGEDGILQTAGMDWNKRMYFDGVDDEVSIADSSDFTITSSIDVSATFMSMDSAAVGIVNKGVGASGNREWLLSINASGELEFIVFDESTGTNVKASTLSWNIGQVYTIRGYYDGANVYLYLDGVLVDSDSGSIAIENLGANIQIGNTQAASRYLTGIISDVSIKVDGTEVAFYQGYGNTNADWEDQIGSNHGTVNGSPSNILIPASDATPTNDALGNAIAEPRPTADTWNLFGDGEYGQVADADSLDVTTEATWEIWGNFYGVGTIAAKYTTTLGRSWLISGGSTAADVRMQFGDPLDGSFEGSVDFSGITNTFGCLQVTFEAGALKCYFNSVDLGAGTVVIGAVPASIYVSANDIFLGANATTGTIAGFFDKKISRPKIYNRALTADEVLQNFNAQKSSFGL